MKLMKSLKMGAWFIAILNLVMALGAVWIFMRMAPAIDMIISRNERSLQACEQMLSSISLIDEDAYNLRTQLSTFESALNKANNNITEKGEEAVISSVKSHYKPAFSGDKLEKILTINAIMRLSDINREAMVQAEVKARGLGNSGAWGIVFMELIVFFSGIIFIRIMNRHVGESMEEVYTVISAYKRGDEYRRCSGKDMPENIRTIYSGINELLDLSQAKRNQLDDKKAPQQ